MISRKITAVDFERMFCFENKSLPDFIYREIESIDSWHHLADPKEQAEYVLDFLKRIDQRTITRFSGLFV